MAKVSIANIIQGLNDSQLDKFEFIAGQKTSSSRYDKTVSEHLELLIPVSVLTLCFHIRNMVSKDMGSTPPNKESYTKIIEAFLKVWLLGADNSGVPKVIGPYGEILKELDMDSKIYFDNKNNISWKSKHSSHTDAFLTDETLPPTYNFVIKYKNFSHDALHIRIGIRYKLFDGSNKDISDELDIFKHSEKLLITIDDVKLKKSRK